MGVLIRQENNYWVLELKEKWYIEHKSEFNELIDTLTMYQFEFTVSYYNNMRTIIEICSMIKLPNLELIKDAAFKMLDLKNKYGKHPDRKN